jgi:hypothetical protein
MLPPICSRFFWLAVALRGSAWPLRRSPTGSEDVSPQLRLRFWLLSGDVSAEWMIGRQTSAMTARPGAAPSQGTFPNTGPGESRFPSSP